MEVHEEGAQRRVPPLDVLVAQVAVRQLFQLLGFGGLGFWGRGLGGACMVMSVGWSECAIAVGGLCV